MQESKIHSNLCPICDNSLLKIFTKKEKRILICAECRHLFWDEMPSMQDIELYYKNDYTEQHQQLIIQESNRDYYITHVQEIENEVGKKAKYINLLDYGSSYPVFLEEFLKVGGQGIAIDSGALVLEWAKDKNIPMLLPEEVNEIDDESFDFIRFSHVLEHLVDPKQELERLLKKLKPGGVVHITQPNFPCLKLSFTNYNLKDSVWPSHLHFFSPISAKIMLERLNCKVYRFNTGPLPEGIELKQLTALVDLPISKKRMADLSHLKVVPETMISYPWYLGENSNIWAEKFPYSCNQD